MLKINSLLKTILPVIFAAIIFIGCGKTDNNTSGQNQKQSETKDAKGTSFKINKSESVIDWTGKKVTESHSGTIGLAGGELFINNGNLTGGSFEVDMKSLKVLDITDADMNSKLTGHLKNDDFFSIDKHPTAKLEITGVSNKGNENYEVTGNLIIKGITKPITFPAVLKVNDKKLTAQANIEVDRTLYDIKYGSGKFFEKLGDKLISDIFTLKVKLSANSQ